MPYIPPEQVAQAKAMDLLTYLRRFDPDELVHVAGNEYSTKTHDSLKISSGLWCWNSRGIAGRSALDYLIKVRDMGFLEAVEHILRETPIIPPPAQAGGSREPSAPLAPRDRRLLLPPVAPNNNRVLAYLAGRGIDRDILDCCIQSGRLYEGLPYHNAVFIGMDTAGTPRYAALRGTKSGYKGETSGSDKHYSFSLPSDGSQRLHLFESAIDVLSYATLLKLHGRDWQAAHLLSLAGVFAPTKGGCGRLPLSLSRYLEDYPGIRRVDLHLDNDLAGRAAARNIADILSCDYEVRDRPPTQGKDVNEALCAKLGISPQKNISHKAEFVV